MNSVSVLVGVSLLCHSRNKIVAGLKDAAVVFGGILLRGTVWASDNDVSGPQTVKRLIKRDSV